MTTFTYPTNTELTEIAQSLLPVLTLDDPIFRLFPISDHDTTLVMWEQEDDFQGLQQVRGLNGEPAKVQPLGAKQYQMTPGVYGEQLLVSERELTERRRYGTFDQPITVDDLVMARVRQLKGREISRIRQILWTLLATQTFSVAHANGAIVHTDSYSTQTFNAIVPWATGATATPLADMSNAALQAAGYSVTFDAGATLFMNRLTWNSFRTNLNSGDLYGRRTGGFGTVNNLSNVNELLTGDDLPTIAVYDRGYKNDAGTFTRLIPNNKAILVGRRDDAAPIGGYYMTRNANNAGMGPGAYTKIADNGADNSDPVPRKIVIHQGHNGGPVITYPSAVLVMTV